VILAKLKECVKGKEGFWRCRPGISWIT